MNRYEAVRAVESSARTYAASFESVFESGEGLRVRDQAGREILDCLACAGSLPLGHNHPEVREALMKFIASNHLQQALDLITPAKFEFVRELFSLLPTDWAGRAKIQFCSPSGSDAVEAAIKLTRYATQRHNIFAFHGAYHGMTGVSLAAMGNLGPKTGIATSAVGVHFLPFPYRFRCPFGSDGSQTDQLSINYLRSVLTDPESGITKPAAVIVEPVQGEGGCIPASVEWLRELRALTREHDIPLILDEVQSGFARTGHMFAFQRAGIVPDVLVLSKALGGGFPLAVVIYDESLNQWPRGMHAGTFRGNQIGMVAGSTTIRVLQRDGLAHHAAAMGERLTAGLRQLAARHPVLGDVRGLGLMIGVEVVQPGTDGRPGPQNGVLAKAIKRCAFESGLLIETGGRHGAVLRFLPPLIITPSDVGAILDRLDTAIFQALKQEGVAHAA